MVARFYKNKPRYHIRYRVRYVRFGLMTFALFALFMTKTQAQNFLNTGGTYKGSGLFQVAGTASGLPDTVTGTFEYFGTDSQQIGAKNYENLLLTGNGSTKKTTINNVNILRTVAVTNGVKLDIASTMILEEITGRITNESGLIVGKVKKTVDLNNTPPDSSDFGGIGASISWSGTNPGLTTITRTSGTALSVNGKSSIQRFLDINTTTDTSLNAKLSFTYNSSELQGQNPSTLDLWRSPDGGASWRRQRVSQNGNTLTSSNIASFGSNGRWTAADASNLLGIANYEWETDSLKTIAGNKQLGRVRKQSDTAFVVRVVDAFNQSLRGQNVQFAIIDTPLGATGQTLSATSATSDASGQVQTKITFGSLRGDYRVLAFVPGVPTAVDTFTATAKTSIASLMIAQIPRTSDSVMAVIAPIVFVAKDQDSLTISQTQIAFKINGPDTNCRVDKDTVITDANGKAPVNITFGKKSGSVVVNAVSIEDPSVKTSIDLNATPGAAAKINNILVGGLAQDTVMKVKQFVINLFDSQLNPKQGDTVLISLTKQTGSTHDSLLTPFVIIDTNKTAIASVRLGEKVGTYTITARAKNNAALSSSQVLTAIPAAPATLAYHAGRGQQQQILTQLDTAFVVQIRDISGNPVSSKPVRFVIDTIPAGAWGQALTDSVGITDSIGYARTWLKFGSKIGTYGVSVKSTALSYDTTVRFSARAYHGIAKIMAQQSGNGQVGQIGDTLSPFVVSVCDTGGNGVPSTQVAFSILPNDTLAKRDTLTVSAATTDSNGLASTSLVFGNRPGRYTVKASVAGMKDTIFVANAILLYADVNHDDYRNIGDLTAIVDHIVGRKLLTGYELLSADMYPRHADGTVGDGIIDIRDVQVCLDSLLNNGWNPTANCLMTSVGSLSKAEGGSAPLSSNSKFLTSKTDSCYVQTTNIGSRFVLTNTVPIKGLQVVMYLKNTVALDTTDIIYPRASMMRAEVKSVGKEVSVILWNVNNLPIEPGNSAIFRLPIQLTNNNVDSIRVLVSSGADNQVVLLNSMQEDIKNSIPRDWMLYQNYPNPFNPTTTIEFDVPELASKIPHAAIQIFNILGQRVRTIERGIFDAGRYSVKWDGMNENGVRVASGVYFYRLLAGDYVSTKKMVMLK